MDSVPTLDELIDRGLAVVALYAARWAPATVTLRKTADEIVSATGAVFVYIDCDEHPSLADRRLVVNLPLAVAYAAGRELERSRGSFGTDELSRLGRLAHSYAERSSNERSADRPTGRQG